MPNFLTYKLLEACREAGCPVCRLEQQGVERYLEHQFYENVNSPAWRDYLRASHGLCHEHAWLSVNKRFGDSLGFSIIYHDIVNSILKHLNEAESSVQAPRRRASSVLLRDLIEKALTAFSPRRRCPVCEHRDKTRHDILASLKEDLFTSELMEALQDSEGLCLPHLKHTLGYIKDDSIYGSLLAIHRVKLEDLRNELAEFIRKNDYRVINEGFGKEGDAWLRTIGMIAGRRRD